MILRELRDMQAGDVIERAVRSVVRLASEDRYLLSRSESGCMSTSQLLSSL